jgi:F-type H+-transporting ATPase subunit epsilon
MEKFIKLDLVTPERKILSQDVQEVVLPGAEGSLGILPGHASMVVALQPGMLKFVAGGPESLYAIGGGYAEITPDKVIVLADTAEPSDEINVEAARLARQQALAQLKQGVHGDTLNQAEVSLKRALAQLQVAEIIRKRKPGGRA